MNATEREQLLSSWIQPSSPDEQIQQDRAERMVKDAVRNHEPLKSASLNVYPKGSYPNNTNVRRDSDVDIAVECQACEYYDYMPGNAPATPQGTPYAGPWTPDKLRTEVSAALINAFGSQQVDTTGKVAVTVAAVASSRPSIDVVPSFDYFLYNDAARRSFRRGACVFPKSGARIINWPDQQLENGRTKNVLTGGRYKNFARALKNAENTLVKAGTIKALPSYFMECLAYNVPASTLQGGTLSGAFGATLSWLWNGLDDSGSWVEPNDVKYLFGSGQKWSASDGKSLVLETWNYLDYS